MCRTVIGCQSSEKTATSLIVKKSLSTIFINFVLVNLLLNLFHCTFLFNVQSYDSLIVV